MQNKLVIDIHSFSYKKKEFLKMHQGTAVVSFLIAGESSIQGELKNTNHRQVTI